MPLNLLKVYSDLLEIDHFQERERTASLKGVFNRDFINNEIHFLRKKIRPIKKEGMDCMEILFEHLTKRNLKDENGRTIKGRGLFCGNRSKRLHWVRFLLENNIEGIKVFSYLDRIDGRSVNRTYIFDEENEYIIILEPQKSKLDYYLISAYFLDEDGSLKQMRNKYKKRLPEVY